MEEMTTQLSIVHNDIQDVLDAVLNPNTKRKRRSGHQDIEPTSDTTQRLMTHKQRRNASPEHSLMHSIHATTTAQDKLDALKIKYPPCSPAMTPTGALPNSLPQVSPQVTPLPDVPITTPAVGEGWKIVEGKTMRRKRRSEQTSNQKAARNNDNTPTTKTGRRGKSTYQPKPTTTPTKKTWAEVVKSGGINVQIVLGNDHLQLIKPTTRARRERQGGAARRLKKKARAGGGTEEERRGRSSPAVV